MQRFCCNTEGPRATQGVCAQGGSVCICINPSLETLQVRTDSRSSFRILSKIIVVVISHWKEIRDAAFGFLSFTESVVFFSIDPLHFAFQVATRSTVTKKCQISHTDLGGVYSGKCQLCREDWGHRVVGKNTNQQTWTELCRITMCNQYERLFQRGWNKMACYTFLYTFAHVGS